MNFIKKINKFLIERYPTIWNTRLVWMLLIASIVHILFFIMGYLSYINPQAFQSYRIENQFFESGFIMVNIIISLLMLVGWLVYMFKNNAFKNFYPLKSIHLFGQFVAYFVIVLASTTFYYSYILGAKVLVNSKYPDTVFKQDIARINQAMPFLVQDYNQYKLSNRVYPDTFTKYYTETNHDAINYSKPYYTNRDDVYQFYSLYEKVVTQKDSNNQFMYPAEEYKNNIPLAYKKVEDKQCIYYFKKEVIDVSKDLITTDLSIYNFSDVFFTFEEDIKHTMNSYQYDAHDEPINEKYYKLDEARVALNKNLKEVLDRNNQQEIKTILTDFLTISDRYNIKTNLNSDTWFKLIYQPKDFVVKKFIIKNDNNTYNKSYEEITYQPHEAAVEATAVATDGEVVINDTENLNTNINYYSKNVSTYYYDTESLKYFLRGVETMKGYDFVHQSIHFYLWIAFALASLIFCFRVTNLRTVIFTAVSAGVLNLFVGFVALVFTFGASSDPKYFIAYFIFILASIILALPILAPKLGSKLFSGVLINMSINGFALYVFLILGIISLHQDDACYTKNYDRIGGCDTILETLDLNTSYLLLVIGFVFILCYTHIIKKWRALPE